MEKSMERSRARGERVAALPSTEALPRPRALLDNGDNGTHFYEFDLHARWFNLYCTCKVSKMVSTLWQAEDEISYGARVAMAMAEGCIGIENRLFFG